MQNEKVITEMSIASLLWWRKGIEELSDEFVNTELQRGNSLSDVYAQIFEKENKDMQNFMRAFMNSARKFSDMTPKLILRTDTAPIAPFLHICEKANVASKWNFPQHASTSLDYVLGIAKWWQISEKNQGSGILYSPQGVTA